MRDVFCQSCALPLKSPIDFGTNVDGTKNRDFCGYCFQRGEFTQPDISLEEMVAMCVSIMRDRNLSDEVIDQAKIMIPQLKRWKE